MPKLFRSQRNDSLPEVRKGRYFLYFLGELLLLVSGILIALQVNNWNESRKAEQQRISLTESIIFDLNRDLTNLNAAIEIFSGEIGAIEQMEARLTDSRATPDTLIQIARFENDPSMPAFVSYSTGTYESMMATGSVELIDRDLFDKLQQLYQLHDVELYYRTGNYDISKDLLAGYLAMFPIEMGVIRSGPIYDAIWRSVDPIELAKQFNAITTMKFFMLNSSLHMYREIAKATEEAIEVFSESIPR